MLLLLLRVPRVPILWDSSMIIIVAIMLYNPSCNKKWIISNNNHRTTTTSFTNGCIIIVVVLCWLLIHLVCQLCLLVITVVVVLLCLSIVAVLFSLLVLPYHTLLYLLPLILHPSWSVLICPAITIFLFMYHVLYHSYCCYYCCYCCCFFVDNGIVNNYCIIYYLVHNFGISWRMMKICFMSKLLSKIVWLCQCYHHLCCSFTLSNKIIVVPSIVSVPVVFAADGIVDGGVYCLLHMSVVRLIFLLL